MKTLYNNSIFGNNYQFLKDKMKVNKYIYHVSFNDTDNLFVFKDKFYKYKKPAEKFYNKMIEKYGKANFEILK